MVRKIRLNTRSLALVVVALVVVSLTGLSGCQTCPGYTFGFMVTKPPTQNTTNSLSAMQTIPMPTFAVESNPTVTVLSQQLGQAPRVGTPTPMMQVAPQRTPCAPVPEQLHMPTPLKQPCNAAQASE